MRRLRSISIAVAALLGGACLTLDTSTIEAWAFECDAGVPCVDGARCWRGMCVADAGSLSGAACAADDECGSGFCTAQVCCNARCDGACESCTGSVVGQCLPSAAGSPGVPACALSQCNGVDGICSATCAGDGQCAPGAFCDLGECVPQLDFGGQCDRTRACDSGFCADGRCCDTACGSPCDSCNVALLEGQCVVSPLGTAGTPSCGAYACNGAMTSCPGTCASDAGCAVGHNCGIHGNCQTSLNTLVDDFNDGVTNAVLWDAWASGGTTLVEQNGRVEMSTAPWLSGNRYSGYTSQSAYDPSHAQATITLTPQGTPSIDNWDMYFVLRDEDDNLVVGFEIYEGEVHLLASNWTDFTTPVPYVPSQHRVLRIRVDGGTVFLETSADGGSFVTRGTTSTQPWMQSTWVEFSAGTWGVGTDAGNTALYDNFNR